MAKLNSLAISLGVLFLGLLVVGVFPWAHGEYLPMSVRNPLTTSSLKGGLQIRFPAARNAVVYSWGGGTHCCAPLTIIWQTKPPLAISS